MFCLRAVGFVALCLVIVPLAPATADSEPLDPDQAPAEAFTSAGQAEEGDCTERPPIRILSDAMFRLGSAVGVANPNAAGTAEDPFIIEGWCIAGVPLQTPTEAPEAPSLLDASILIQDTSYHVLIRDNVIDGDRDLLSLDASTRGVGIHLEKADNVTVQDNDIRNHTGAGIALEGGYGFQAEGNRVQGNGGPGIVARPAEGVKDRPIVGDLLPDAPSGLSYIEVRENRVHGNGGPGVAIDDADHSQVQANRIHDNAGHGIELEDADDSEVQGNEIHGNGATGLELRYVDASQAHGNAIWNNTETGVYVAGPAPTVEDNRIEGNGATGVTMVNAHGAAAVGNTIEGHTEASVELRSSLGGSAVQDNELLGNASVGVYAEWSEDAIIENNTIQGHDEVGIDISMSDGAHIEANRIEGINGTGVRAVPGDHGTTIEDNVIRSNEGWGLRMEDTFSNRISNNTIEDNGQHGMELDFAAGTTVEDNLVRANAVSGVDFEYSSSLSVHGNRVEDNGGLGIGLNRGSSGTVANNTVTGNVVGIDFGNSVGTVENNTVTGQSDDGVRVGLDPDVAVHRNNIERNEGYGLLISGVYLTSDEPVDARHNWWGDPSGPGGGVSDECVWEAANGDGDEIWLFYSQDTVCFTPWLEEPNPEAGAG